MTKKAEAQTDAFYSQRSSDWPEGRSTGKKKKMEIFEVSMFHFQIETGFVNLCQLKQQFSLRNNLKCQRRCTCLPSCIGDLEWTWFSLQGCNSCRKHRGHFVTYIYPLHLEGMVIIRRKNKHTILFRIEQFLEGKLHHVTLSSTFEILIKQKLSQASGSPAFVVN